MMDSETPIKIRDDFSLLGVKERNEGEKRRKDHWQ